VEAILWFQHDKSITNLFEDEDFVKNLMDIVYFCFANGKKRQLFLSSNHVRIQTCICFYSLGNLFKVLSLKFF